jgi:hypothetical protein
MSGLTNEAPIWKVEVIKEGVLFPPWCFSIMDLEQAEKLSLFFGNGEEAARRNSGGNGVRNAEEEGNEDGR